MERERAGAGFRYPLHWHLMDAMEAVAERLWPRRFSRHSGWILILPAVLLVGILVLGLVETGASSLHVLDTSTFRLSEHYTLDNYRTALASKTYRAVLTRSVLGAALTVLFTLILGFPFAYMLVRTERALVRKALLVTLFLPFFIGQVVRAYGILILLGTSGVVNKALGMVGIEPLRLLYNFPAVVFGEVQYMLPFAVLMLAPALTAIPRETEVAANSLGADWLRTLWHVIVPMARPGLVGATLIVGTLTLTDFAIPAMLGGGSQDFIANSIYDQFFRTSDQGLGSALTLLLVLVGSTFTALAVAVFGIGTLGMRQGDK